MEYFIPLLQKTPLFPNFSDQELETALHAMDAQTISYQRDALIFKEGQFTDKLGIVIKGSITIERIDYFGNRNILSYNHQGQLFAETYALLSTPMMVDVVAKEDCTILFLRINKINQISLQGETWLQKLIHNLLYVSTQKNLILSKHNFHTSSKSIRGRVLSYLSDVALETGSHEFDIPFNRQQMADYLGLDRSALSGELSKMRNEGLIAYRKNHFVLYE